MKKAALIPMIIGNVKTRIRAVLITLAFIQILLFSPMIGINHLVGNSIAIGNSTIQNEVYWDESLFASERYDMQYGDNIAFDSIGPASSFVSGELLIKITPDISITPFKSARGIGVGEASLDSLMQKYGVYSIQKIFRATSGKLSRWYGIEFPESFDVASVVKEFRKNPKIVCVTPNYICSYHMDPDDYYYDQQWALNNIGQSYLGVKRNPGYGNDEQVLINGTYDSDIDAPEAWNITVGSKEVVVAVIDSGVDYNHEDIASNIWINPGEDINHNGIVDSGDFDGIDTDGNGYIDDIRGYDFYYNDTNPMDFLGHGTHVAGTIAALTNNSKGVAGVAGNVSIMPLKIGSDGESLSGSAAARAIEYAADNGAKILSNSWGAIYPEIRNEAIEDAIEYAYSNKSCVVVFSAGNENSLARYYPAAGNYVVAVAATNSTDQKVWFSNYGDWVDVCAPGHDILSLRASGTDMYAPEEPNVHIVGNKYYLASGTSMAAPHVSGVAALIASKFPQASNEEIISRLLSTADNIDELNPDYSGWLGTGRVNAYKALSTAPRPKLVFNRFIVDDSQGDGDGLVDPGETVQMTIRLRNLWIEATNVVANLTSTDPYVTILDGTSSFGNISTGSSRVSETPYTVSFSSDMPTGHGAIFKLSIIADNGYADIDYFRIPISVFADVTFEAGVEGDPSINRGIDVVWGDYDNDGWLDMFVVELTDTNNILYHNNGDGTFTNVTSQAGLSKTTYMASSSAAFGDYDNDGDLDLYLGNDGANVLYRNNGNGTFTNVTGQAGVYNSGEAWDVIFGDYNNDGWLDIYVVNFDASPNVLYRNNGDGTFTNVASGAGVNYPGETDHAVFFDYDNDGFLDIYLTSYYNYNVLYRNNGDGTFSNVTGQAGVAGWQNGAHDVAVADYDNDGFLDMYVSFEWYEPGTDYESILYHNNGDGTFEDKTSEAGVGGVTSALEVLFGDYDNDGDQDLFAARFFEPLRLFRNNGDGTFTDFSHTIESNAGTATYGAGFGDYNNDGYIDLYLTRLLDRNTLYRNNLQGNNWLIIKTIGEVSNRDGIGAKVTVKTGTHWQTQEVSASSGNSIPLEFGLGSYSKADLVKVTWPSGIVSEIPNVQANQTINIFEAPIRNINTGLRYLTIQEAIDAPETLDGHTIFVEEGIYYEHIVVSKSLTLNGEKTSTTIIDGNATGTCFKVLANNVNIAGFTIKNSGSDWVDAGIYVDESSSNNISHNHVTNNNHGIRLSSSSNNSIYGNKITNNMYGIMLELSSNNFIYHNNFVNNTDQVYTLDSMNVWDDGYPSGGNYWSDYNDVDLFTGPYQNETGSDGVGDTPYVIDADNQDNYPLMSPWTELMGDIDGDGDVDSVDFNIFAEAYGSSPPSNPDCDLDRDGDVDSVDFNVFAGNYGRSI